MNRGRPLASRSPAKAEKWQRREAFSRAVIARAGGRCEGCGAYGRRLDAHHLVSKSGAQLDDRIASTSPLGAALCHDHPSYGQGCHSRAHGHDPVLLQQLVTTAMHRLDAAQRVGTMPAEDATTAALVVSRLLPG